MINLFYVFYSTQYFLPDLQDGAPSGGGGVDGEGGAAAGDALQDGRNEDDGQVASRAQGTRNLFCKGQLKFALVLSLIFQYTFLTAFGQKRLVSCLAVPHRLYRLKHTACSHCTKAKRKK